MSWLKQGRIVAIGVVVAGTAAGCGSTQRDAPENRLGPRDYRAEHEAQAFKGFAVYSLGNSFEGLPLTGVDRADKPVWHGSSRSTEPTRSVPDFAFIYGPCTRPGDHPPDADHGCTQPQIQVSSTPLCASDPKTYGTSLGPLRRYGAGALVAIQNDVTVFTGKTVVSIIARDERQALRVMPALRPVNNPDRPARLIAPVRAGIRGKLPCGPLSHPSR